MNFMAEKEVKNSAEIPVIAETDVLVVGAGPGGLGAAVTAARNGVNVLLAERYGCPGGMSVFGEVSPMMGNHHAGRPMDRPVYMEWLQQMWNYRSEGMHRSLGEDSEFNPAVDPPQRIISKEMSLLAMEELLLNAGVSLLYHHTLVGVEKEGSLIKSTIFHSKSGFGKILAKQYIDATGDGDMAAFSGCGFDIGNESGHCQPMTLCFKLSGIDMEKVPPREEINRLYELARQNGEIHCLRENVLMFNALPERTFHFNTTRIIHTSGISGKDLSYSEVEGRRQVREFYNFFKKRVPGFTDCYISSIAHHIGVRETRRIHGRVRQTVTDFLEMRKYPDGIAKMRYMIDIHNPDGSGTEIHLLPPETWYEIRYPALLPADCDNLVMGCRAISVDQGLHSSTRVMPQVCSVGQAAGMAAAMAVKEESDVSELDGKRVREKLKEYGADL